MVGTEAGGESMSRQRHKWTAITFCSSAPQHCTRALCDVLRRVVWSGKAKTLGFEYSLDDGATWIKDLNGRVPPCKGE
jgi:hypothetical protein